MKYTIDNITGVTEMAIIRAIITGERNPQVFAELKNSRIKTRSQSALGAFYHRLHAR